MDLSTLNDNQKAAVDWNSGAALILAGPGSGKTKVLTLRVARLIKESLDDNFRILGLTFTTKAAAEMRERIQSLLGNQLSARANLCTFHSFCTEILRQYGSHLGLKPDFLVLSQQVDREQMLLEVIRSVNGKHPELADNDISLLTVIDRLLSNSVEDSKIKDWISRSDILEKVKLLYPAYRQRLLAENKVDFPTIIYFAEQLLNQRAQVRKQIQTIYPFVCVDEFQDTNLAQYRILKLLLPEKNPNIFIVADDDQVIYQWNGASPERLEELKRDYKAEVIQLPANYRCPPKVIQLANNLIKNNTSRSASKKPLVAMKNSQNENSVILKNSESFEEELKWLVQTIKAKGAAQYSKCAVLARTSKLVEAAASALLESQIPAHIVTRKADFESAPLVWIYAMLRLAGGRGDKEQLRKVCRSFFRLEGVDVPVDRFLSESAANSGDLLRTWFEVIGKDSGLEAETKSFLTSIKKPLLDQNAFQTFVDSAFKWCDKVEAKLGSVQEEHFSSYGEEKELWLELQKDIVSRIGEDDLSLHSFLQELDLAPKTSPAPPNAVRCLTVHSSKGMEFNHVFLIGMVEDQIPSFQSIKQGDTSKEMEEERRNCFVAITRTQETLSLSYAKSYFGWQKKPSRFLVEMGLLGKT